MCGRYSLTKEVENIRVLFDLDGVPRASPRYNIAPTQPVGAVIQDRHTGKRQWKQLHWGLIPSWAKDPSIGNRMINARSETVTQKPAFRSAIKYRRCLIPADGFYEWRKLGATKQPYHITLAEGNLFAFAGLWEQWQGEGGEEIDSCTILTTEANDLMQPIHNRMPVILEQDSYERWLHPALHDPSEVTPLLQPLRPELMIAEPVSTFVNNPRNDGPPCVERVSQ